MPFIESDKPDCGGLWAKCLAPTSLWVMTMRQRGYTIAFVLVLLLACVGGFFGGRLVLQQVQQDFGRASGWTPQASTPAVQEIGPATLSAAPIVTPTSQPRPSATTLVVATPVGAPTVPVETSIAGETSTPVTGDPVTPAPNATETATPTASPQPAFPYVLARSVRHTAGDCAGTYVLGQITDRTGGPLSNIRLKLVDEWGHEAAAISKAGQADLGRYDFPLYGAGRRFFLTVVDAAGRPLSAEVEIRHGLAPNADASCHWVDWRRQ